MYYAGLLSESLVNGPGVRAVVFMQGCLRQCPGCHNPDTWPLYEGYQDTVSRVWDMLYPNPLVEGLTISGGEPLLQPHETFALAKKAQDHGWNVMLYTGFDYEVIQDTGLYKPILKYVNWIVVGPYIEALKTVHPYYGSSNQRLITLNPLT